MTAFRCAVFLSLWIGAAAQAVAALGLVAEYRSDGLVLREIVPTPNFFLESGESLHPALSPEFEARFDGALSILRGGEYRFYFEGARLSIAGEEVGEAPVRLRAGSRAIELRFRRRAGPAKLRLEWEGPSFGREPVPERAFSHDEADGPGPDEMLVEEGRRLVEDLGCVNCHAAESASLKGRAAPVLSSFGARASGAWIKRWLDDPAALRASAVMPTMLTESERVDVAVFLASERYEELIEPRYSERTRTRRDAGQDGSAFQSYGCPACHGARGVSLDGIGSKTRVGPLQRFLLDPLKSIPDGRMPSFHLSGPEALELAEYLSRSRKAEFEAPLPAGDPARGRELISATGCLACHRMTPLENRASAPALASLDPNAGCLADEVPERLPRYRLESRERGALRAFLTWHREHPDRGRAPVYEFRRLVERLRCNGCHEWGGRAPTGALAEYAPSLSGVGEKLQSGWIGYLLSEETHTLQGLELRMPGFGRANAEVLAEGFAKAAGLAPGPGAAAPAASEAARSKGHGMLGVDAAAGGLGCIGCHGWAEFPSLGENGPQLSTAARRLRYDWFRRWMRDPARVLSGTSMPNYFGAAEPAEARESIDALWAAFRAAETLPPPAGFETKEAPHGGEEKPHPSGEPIVIRWDMPEATPSAIAVGLPGGVSYCFDAGESRLRYVWLGGFLDMSPTLFQKKNKLTGLTETAHLIGEIFFREGEAPLRVGDPERIPQRRFRGYRLVDSHPRFHYQVDGIDVYERITATADKRGVRREFTIPRVAEPMWFRVTEAPGVQIRSTLGEPRDGLLRVPRGENVSFEISVKVQVVAKQ